MISQAVTEGLYTLGGMCLLAIAFVMLIGYAMERHERRRQQRLWEDEEDES